MVTLHCMKNFCNGKNCIIFYDSMVGMLSGWNAEVQLSDQLGGNNRQLHPDHRHPALPGHHRPELPHCCTSVLETVSGTKWL